MNTLIVGGAGFVGPYLAECLCKDSFGSVFVTKLPGELFPSSDKIQTFDLDILNMEAVKATLVRLRPEFIFHLAAQSSVALSWTKPFLTVDVNIKGCLTLLESVRSIENYHPRILLIGSGEEYGRITESQNPISEDTAPHPGNIYAVTKLCQNMIGELYSKAYQMDIVSVRAFNHIGPHQRTTFVLPDFCKQVSEIEANKREPLLYVGNLSARRDFSDVRDIVSAYSLLAKKGISGETYNVGRGKAISIQDLLDMVLSNSSKNIQVFVDPQKYRPIDLPVIEADIHKLRECTGWEPTHSLQVTVIEVLTEWRNQS